MVVYGNMLKPLQTPFGGVLVHVVCVVLSMIWRIYEEH